MKTLVPALLLLLSVLRPVAAGESEDSFAAHIEPLFRQHCYECHSHASGKMKGGLTLDSRSGWEEGGNSGPALVAGQPQASLLLKAVGYSDKDLQMPPKKKLSDAEIGFLTDWVLRGAPAPRATPASRYSATTWWALQPLVRPPVPASADSGSNPIDAFVAAKLREKGLSFSPEAGPRTLVRRLTFDLHGLPPTPGEVDAFVRATREDASAAEASLVKRLLDSPRYGERFARLWLDVAHYGESDGFGMDRPRHTAWPYRDYVIAAFNEDRPYARFVQEQIAADYLFAAEPRLIAALGFVAAGPFNQSALSEQVDGTDCKKIALNLDRDDMVSTVASTFLSVTLHCARCHEHKFDPISQRDYYRVQACFAGLVRGERDFDDDPSVQQQRVHWTELQSRLAAGGSWNDIAEADRADLSERLPDLLATLRKGEARWQSLDVKVATTSAKTQVVHLPDLSIRFEGEALDKDTYTLKMTTPMAGIAALRIEVLADPALPHGGPGRNPQNGNLHLNEVSVSAAPINDPQKPAPVKIKLALADFDQAGWEVKKAIDGNPATAWGIHPAEGRSHAAVFVFEKPLVHPQGSALVIKLEQSHGEQHLIGRLRVSLAEDAATASVPPPSPDLDALLKTARTPEDRARLSGLAAGMLIAERLAGLPPVKRVFAVGSGIPAKRNYKPPKVPYPIHILRRGDLKQPAAEVQPGALQCVSALSPHFALSDPNDEASRRAALARWITDPANPLTWRSIANRVWQWHFGRGIVETPNDFGKMGAAPSHPELLDWLACEIRDGASLKQVHEWILTSRTYRQSSDLPPHAPLATDAENHWLWRQNRQRLDAEQLRDAVLAVSGTLDATMGGPSAMQFNYSDPNPNVVPRIDYEGFNPDSPPSFRRSVYRYIFRNANDPLLEAFDSANPTLSTPRRNTTITSLQALSLYNNPFMLRQCEHLAERLSREADGIESQIDRAFALLYARPPAADEREALGAYARQHGLANTCRVLFNTNEFLFLP